MAGRADESGVLTHKELVRTPTLAPRTVILGKQLHL